MRHLETEIHEVEVRLAAGRAEYRREFDEYKDRLRDQATSFTSLAVLVAVGFVAGSLLRQRPKGGSNGGSSLGAVMSLAASVLPAVVRLREHHRHSELARGLLAPAPSTEGFVAVEEARGGGAT